MNIIIDALLLKSHTDMRLQFMVGQLKCQNKGSVLLVFHMKLQV